MILTGGFDVLTAGFDGFDVLTAGFEVLMILTGGFDGFDVLTAGFWCFWWFWQEVFVFEGCILNHVIMTVGFVLWRRCYQEIPLPPQFPIAAYLGLCCEKLWSASPTNICFLKQKLIVYKIAY